MAAKKAKGSKTASNKPSSGKRSAKVAKAAKKTSSPPSPKLTLASFAQMGRIMPNLHEAVLPKTESILSPTAARAAAKEQNRMLAAVSDAMQELRGLPALDGVMSAPRSPFASILQSTFAEMAAARGNVESVDQMNTLEAKFDTHDVAWVQVAWEKFKSMVHGKIGFIKPRVSTRLPETARLAVFGDWGTGLYGAPMIGAAIQGDPKRLDAVVHLGDTYYSGTAEEFAERFVPFWPFRDGAVNRSTNGNHEMYSGGTAYLNTVQTKFQQDSSVFVLENNHWLIVGLDTALNDHDLDSAQLKWLKPTLDAAAGRKIMLLSHHQPYSTLESQGESLAAKLKPWLGAGKVFAWYWGHEHRCVLYAKHDQYKMYGRCIGHGGMPQTRESSWGDAPLKPRWMPYGPRKNVPAAEILDGPNPFILKHEKDFLPHGYAVLQLDGPKLIEEIRDAQGFVIRAARELT